MSTLEVVCGRCSKKFRVRAEFAGRSTRCPGCSSPITIGGTPAAVPTARLREEDRPRPRLRKRDEEDEEPISPSSHWVSVERALQREQWAILFVFASILGGFFVACLGSMVLPSSGVDGLMPFIFVLFGVGPVLVAAGFGLMARMSALNVPPESGAKGTAIASLLCAIAVLGCIVGLGFSFLISLESGQRSELPMIVSLGGLVFSALAAWATFTGFTAQVGIARKSFEVSRGIGRMATTVALSTLAMIGIGILYALVSEVTSDGRRGYYKDHSSFYRIMLGILVPLDAGLLLILYHRLLSATRRSIGSEPKPRYYDRSP